MGPPDGQGGPGLQAQFWIPIPDLGGSLVISPSVNIDTSGGRPTFNGIQVSWALGDLTPRVPAAWVTYAWVFPVDLTPGSPQKPSSSVTKNANGQSYVTSAGSKSPQKPSSSVTKN